jgi:hypothetical protein
MVVVDEASMALSPHNTYFSNNEDPPIIYTHCLIDALPGYIECIDTYVPTHGCLRESAEERDQDQVWEACFFS